MQIRLNQFLSRAGISSRRDADQLIKTGKIKVNGKPVKTLGVKVDPAKDKIEFQEQEVVITREKVYLALNKPRGYLSTTRDDFNRPKVIDLIKDQSIRLYPVGRLDLDTEGLLILTNDGDFAYKLTHPRHQISKVYRSELNRPLRSDDKKKLEKGVELEEGKTLPAEILTLSGNKIQITIYEGKKRQIKRMLALFNYKVIKLKRTAIGPLKLGNIGPGRYRRLKSGEIKALLKDQTLPSLKR